MNCSACGTTLSQGVAYCPNCGTPTSSMYSSVGTTPDSATLVSTPPPPPTSYGPQAFEAAEAYKTPSVPYDPYNVAPPPPSPQKPGKRMGLIIGLILLALVLILGGVGATLLLRRQPQIIVTPTQATAAAQVQATKTVTSAQTAVALATTQANATATAQVNIQLSATITTLQNTYTQATSGSPVLIDPLSGQNSNNWDEGSSCAFTGGAYHVTAPHTNFFNCNAQSTNFANFAFQVQMVIAKGDAGGVLFRSDSQGNNGYYFIIQTNGAYVIKVYKNNNQLSEPVSAVTTDFKQGIGQSNTITVIAQGSNLKIFINGQFAVGVTDTNFTTGEIGMVADNFTNPTDAAFSNLKIWKL